MLPRLTALIATLALLLPTATAQDDRPAAARRLDELVAMINEGGKPAMEKYLTAALGGGMADLPMAMHLRIMGDMHARGPWATVKTQANGDNGRAALLRDAKAAWVRITIEVEPNGEHRITSIGISAATAPPTPSKGDRYTKAEIRTEMDRTLDALHASDRFSGAVILARGDEIVYSGVRGHANKDFAVDNDLETKFNLGSMNKMFTAVAIAQLVEAGKLAFDDPLSKFLPEFPTAEAARKVRIEHLLTHTSGLGSYFNQKFLDSSRARFRTVEQLLTLAADERLAFEPGSRWQYSNTGFLVLGRVIEVVSQQDYHDYIREHVTGPTGMTSTDCYELDRVNRNLAVGYARETTPTGTKWRNNVFRHVIRGGPAGGGYSTVSDLVRFASALRAGKLISPAMFERMLRPRPDLSSPNYGYGFGLAANGSVGHSGGFDGISSNLSFWPAGEWTIAVMSNYSGGQRPVMDQALQLIDLETK